MIPNKPALILLGLVLFPIVFGCREEEFPPAMLSAAPEIPQDMIDEQVRRELESIGLTPSSDNPTAPAASRGRPTGMTLREEIDETLQQAKKIVDPQKRELVHIDLVKRLTLFKEYAEATAAVRFIRDVDEHDSLLEDITRIRMSDILHEFSIVQRISQRNATNIQGALESARLIRDPMRRARSLGNIALLRANMNDRAGSRETAHETADIVRRLPNDNPQKALGLHRLIRLLLRLEANDGAETLCREIESLLLFVESVENRGKILATLAEAFVTLRDLSTAKDFCQKGFSLAEQTEDPRKKLSLLLDLTETFLRLPLGSPEGQLRDVKRVVLDAATAIPAPPSSPTAPFEAPSNFIRMDGEELLSPTGDTAVLSWVRLKAKKNEILRIIAVMQAWHAPLDDVWETVEDIDDVVVRDEAVAETITMMIATKAWEDAVGWSDEISDPELKKDVRRKIKNAMAEGKE